MAEDRDNLHSIFLQQRDALARFLTRRMGCAETAQDLTQETWLRIARVGGGEDICNPRAYLFRIAANVAADHRRAEIRRRLAPDEVDNLLAVPDETPGPEAVAEARSDVAALREALAELPERRREILILNRLQGMTQRAIAEKLGLSTRTVEKEIQRALEHCGARLGKKAGRRCGMAKVETS